MDPEDFPEPEVEVDVVTPSSLKHRIDTDEPVTILDTRMESEYHEWHIDGDSVESINVPYFHFLDKEIDPSILETIPDDRPLTVVCAKGGASDFVAGTLAIRGYDVDHLSEGMNGWAQIYDAVEVEAYDGVGTVIQYQRPSTGCLGYLIADAQAAAVVDPLRAFRDRYLADAEALGVPLIYAIDTHIHADHLSGVRALVEEGVTGVIPRASADRGATYADAMELIDDGDELTVGDITVRAIHTPGHTTDMTSYLVEDRLLLTGDGLFTESVARPDLEEGDDGAPAAARMLHSSLHECILTLPEETIIGPAHYSDAAEPHTDGTYTATIGELVTAMEALSLDKEEFVELILSDMPPRPANYETIIPTNLGQESVDDETAFELELGPNNCAASRGSLAAD